MRREERELTTGLSKEGEVLRQISEPRRGDGKSRRRKVDNYFLRIRCKVM